jgi:hypothetical protein
MEKLDSPRERLEYLKERREEQNVAFTAIFLQALGKLGFSLGEAAEWDPTSPLLEKVRGLDPDTVNYVARSSSGKYQARWRNAMMKLAVNRDTGEEKFVFNNVSDSIRKTASTLASLIDLKLEGDSADFVEDSVTRPPSRRRMEEGVTTLEEPPMKFVGGSPVRGNRRPPLYSTSGVKPSLIVNL